MSGPLRIVLAGALMAFPAACSLLVDTSDLAGDEAPADQRDGAPETSTPVDAATPADARVLDAADAATPCVGGPTRLCDDFDHPGSRWSDPFLNRGTVSVDGNGLSLPNALRAQVVAGTGGGAASLGQDLDGNPTRVRCELDAKLDAVPTAGEVDIIDLFAVTPGAENHHFYLGSFDGAWSVAEYREASDAGARIDRAKAIGTALPIDVWMHIVFDLSPSSLTITANGHAMTLADLTIPTGAVRRRLNAGVTYASSKIQAAGATIDNVDCTLAP